MYQVLFAEDELLVRLGLQNSIPWEKYNMQLAAQADNGIDAFREFQRIRPDVVITDIRMEGMDGVELIQKIREIDESCAIIVISCLDDFETLRKMIPYNIIGYILKASMSMDEIFGMLQEAEEFLKKKGRIGVGISGEVEDNLAKKLEKYFLEEGTLPVWDGEKRIKKILGFSLSTDDKCKINDLAMKFVYELVGRCMPEGILIETGEKEFSVLVPEYVDDLDDKISRINRSVEGFLGVDFFVSECVRESKESLRELYRRMKEMGEDHDDEEKNWDKMIQKAVQYMREHYQESLSLQEISGILGLSSSYFSHLCICSEPPLVENDIRVSVQRFADSRECIYSMLAG